MKIFPNRGKSKSDKSLALFYGEAATTSVESAGCAYQSPSIIATGAEAQSVAFLSVMTNLVLGLLLIKVPSLVEGKTPMKKTVVLIATISAATWLPIILLLLLFVKVSPFLLIALWIVSLVPTTLMIPLRDNWLANLVPSEKMGRYLSWRSAVAGVFYLITFYLMGYTLDSSAAHISRGYAFVLCIAFVASVGSVFLYSSIRPPAPIVKSQTAPTTTFISFLKGARKEHLGTFILFVSLFTFAVNLSGPLLSVYMLNELHFSYMTFTAIVSSEYIARIISLAFWGKQVDKVGSLKILRLVSYLIPISPILWLLSGNFFYLCVAQIFAGTLWAAFDLCCQTFLFKSTQPEHRLRYIVYYRSLTTLSVALGALVSALLLNNMIAIRGSQILGMVLLSGVMRLVVSRVMLPKLKPGGIPDAIVHEELARELEKVNYPARQGLHYHPETWSRVVKGAAAFGAIIGKAVNKLSSPRPVGLYYNPQKWASYMGHNSDLQPAMVQVNSSEPDPEGLYYNQQTWSDYMNPTSANQVANTRISASAQIKREALYYNPEAWAKFINQTAMAEAKSIENKKPAREGLFYNTQRWADYLKRSLVLNATTIRTGGEGITVRQPVFYHPEIWAQYKNQSSLSRVVAAKVSAMPARQALFYHPEEWDRFIDPAMVRIGRKSAIGTTFARQNTVKKLERRELSTRRLPVTTPPLTTKRIRISLSPA
ncbi:MAG: MFS transporter [Chloroflexi bacterium]|nr:MFS transporter [Chloroflexota bacterium]